MNDEIEMHDRSDGCKIRWQQLIIEPTVNVIDKQPTVLLKFLIDKESTLQKL